jgi:hypothetical protein
MFGPIVTLARGAKKRVHGKAAVGSGNCPSQAGMRSILIKVMLEIAKLELKIRGCPEERLVENFSSNADASQPSR